MRITTRKKGSINILELSGNVTHAEGSDEFRRSFMLLLDAGERQFILDMRGASMVDSMGLSETVACHKRAREREGVIKLVLRGKPLEMFRITYLDKVFEIYEDLESALVSFVPK